MVRLLIFFFAIFYGLQTFAADCGRFAVVKQPVEFKEQGKDKVKKARKNGKVCQGYTIITGPEGRAKIKMADSNEINISPGSELIIETYQNDKKAVLNVLNGKVRSDVKRKYEDSKTSHYRVKTKSAVAGVRGTEFLTSYDASTNQSRVVTFEGQVAVGKMIGGSFVPKVIVKPGQFTASSSKEGPHPAREVPAAELSQMDSESKVTDSPSKAPASAQPEAKTEEPEDNAGEEAAEPEKKPENPKKPKARARGAAGAVDADGPDGGTDLDLEGDGSDGERGIASVDDGGQDPAGGGEQRDVASVNLDEALPEPDLELEGGSLAGSLPDTQKIFDPPPPPPDINTICQTCTDNSNAQPLPSETKVNVTIIPRLPGQ